MGTARLRRQDERSMDGVRLQRQVERCVQKVAYNIKQKDVQKAPSKLKTFSKSFSWMSGRPSADDDTLNYAMMDDLLIDRECFNKIIDDEEMLNMLDLMEISCTNRFDLFDVLDA